MLLNVSELIILLCPNRVRTINNITAIGNKNILIQYSITIDIIVTTTHIAVLILFIIVFFKVNKNNWCIKTETK